MNGLRIVLFEQRSFIWILHSFDINFSLKNDNSLRQVCPQKEIKVTTRITRAMKVKKPTQRKI